LPALPELWAAGDECLAMIRIERLRFGYRNGDDVLRLDEFVLEQQSNVLVVGPSGCGKTTLLHLIAGLLLPGSGQVIVDGQDLSEISPSARDRFRGQHIGIVLTSPLFQGVPRYLR
jgi:ABC-type lipoprotein export system ATPase subunit